LKADESYIVWKGRIIMPRKRKKSKSEKEWEKFGMKMAACTIKDHMYGHKCGGAIYGLGFIGALVYYVTTAPDFWAAVVGILKAIVWPAFLVHGLLTLLGA
jgi:hypothetical protein